MNPLENYYANHVFSNGNNTTASDHPAPAISTIGMTTSQAAEIIKGEIGSIVVLRINRPSSKERINFENWFIDYV